MNKTKLYLLYVFFLIDIWCMGAPAFANSSYSPYVDRQYPENVYFGDTHVHTNLSVDAYLSGTRLGPEDAYRYAKGETLTASNGMKVRISKPLDFLVVADHAFSMGVIKDLDEQAPNLLNTEVKRRWSAKLKAFKEAAVGESKETVKTFYDLWLDIIYEGIPASDSYRHSVWQTITSLADQHNEPGKFTAFIGYEWTPLYYLNHRVVLFSDGAEKADQTIPFSQYDSQDPEDLWKYLDGYTLQTGGDVLAIPHSADGSGGVMFALQDAKGRALSPSYAKTRSRWEPLYETTQMMGDSETHPLLSPQDEFADYETYPSLSKTNWLEKDFVIERRAKSMKKRGYTDYQQWQEQHKNQDKSWILNYGYARSALKLGLQEQSRIGVNPFKFGLIGSSDTHTALAGADENNNWGKSGLEPRANRMEAGWWRPASGYAAVWATDNTREALFEAMKRKETYATTGPRMTVRFFGGWNYEKQDAFIPDLAKSGYSKGVPMGGDLSDAPRGKSPSFLIRAVKDPNGANLDRVQVIKGWRSGDGDLHEKIYNVALSDGRKEGPNGKVPPVVSTVDVADASYTNATGDPELAVVWVDPDFNKEELAFYYVRVLEIPTPRWTAYDAKYFNLKNISKEVPMIIQERAYTSPIWYTP